ncbi:helix-turn-helix transcriptional regulator [Paenibacillus tarimensis]|uniref:helix-turn-helix transcriptional regulator n=1 Tax=Paenibacillus tarimensis TaxID=416012 RepID=UPI001F17E7D7|nr:helix-turn-helix domain-containing protein [Paenibacillus tarimensis]MCF2943521.1 AraC family transcriptional regulator [Paenibacillus tarimensis]
MKPQYLSIVENILKNLHVEVVMAAYSEVEPGKVVSGIHPDFYRLVLIMSGEGYVQINSRRYEARPGQLFLLPAGCEQTFGIYDKEKVCVFWCHYRINLGDAALYENLELPAYVVPQDFDAAAALFRKMVDAYASPTLSKGLIVKAALLEAISLYWEGCEIMDEQLAANELVTKMAAVLNYIDDHLGENITLDDLAKVAYLHPNYFISMFKSVIGQSPIHYVNQRRMEMARALLVASDVSVADIAAVLGMKNHYLSRLFKQETGISPSRYRQINRKAIGLPVHSSLDVQGYIKRLTGAQPAALKGEEAHGNDK